MSAKTESPKSITFNVETQEIIEADLTADELLEMQKRSENCINAV
jgi:hypothetical protein